MITIDKDTAHMKSKLAVDFADLVYNGKWFTPLREALQRLCRQDPGARHRPGEAEALQGQHHHRLASPLPCSLYSEKLVTFNESDYNQADATGFINLWGLPDTVLALREQGKL